ncbi:MAG: DUF1553 domain-containing protein, partial [Planctomycetia bacterium]|nr:DUF1553 domain-containing protein [Planctomycetia bacterium]
GSSPTHPELLDWLAVDFMEHGWSTKRLHRLMMMSTAYRQSAHRPSAGKAIEIDPENELLSRMNLRRLEAEVLRDSVLAVSGKLDPTVGGAPIAVTSNPDGLVTISDKGPNPAGKWRRSIYVRSLRGSHPSGTGLRLSMLEVFDFPEVVINCTRRVNSTTPLQSLTLMNSAFMQEQSRNFAERVRGIAGDDRPALQIETAFVLAFGRTPSARESEFCLDYLKEQQVEYQQANPEPGKKALGGALAGLCSMLLASNEFLYNG